MLQKFKGSHTPAKQFSTVTPIMKFKNIAWCIWPKLLLEWCYPLPQWASAFHGTFSQISTSL